MKKLCPFLSEAPRFTLVLTAIVQSGRLALGKSLQIKDIIV
jgi:hypothetical protein